VIKRKAENICVRKVAAGIKVEKNCKNNMSQREV
jgi:hypothetical protein